jgi:hypothetical protein
MNNEEFPGYRAALFTFNGIEGNGSSWMNWEYAGVKVALRSTIMQTIKFPSVADFFITAPFSDCAVSRKIENVSLIVNLR